LNHQLKLFASKLRPALASLPPAPSLGPADSDVPLVRAAPSLSPSGAEATLVDQPSIPQGNGRGPVYALAGASALAAAAAVGLVALAEVRQNELLSSSALGLTTVNGLPTSALTRAQGVDRVNAVNALYTASLLTGIGSGLLAVATGYLWKVSR
jgi:hypothetical protein